MYPNVMGRGKRESELRAPAPIRSESIHRNVFGYTMADAKVGAILRLLAEFFGGDIQVLRTGPADSFSGMNLNPFGGRKSAAVFRVSELTGEHAFAKLKQGLPRLRAMVRAERTMGLFGSFTVFPTPQRDPAMTYYSEVKAVLLGSAEYFRRGG